MIDGIRGALRSVLPSLRRCLIPALAPVLMLSACASLRGGGADARLDPADQQCLALLNEMDRVTAESGRADGQAAHVAGFPYLRIDRFTESFKGEVADPARYRAWVDRMRTLDQRAREIEIRNLRDSDLPLLRIASRDELRTRSGECGARLVERDALDDKRKSRLLEAATVPDDYLDSRRVIGLYPLTGMLVAAGTRSAQREMTEAWKGEGRIGNDGIGPYVVQRYEPVRSAQNESGLSRGAAEAAGIVRDAPRDVLGIPRLDDAKRAALLDAFAPSYDIVTSADHDRFGSLQWIDLEGLVAAGADRYWLDVDPATPMVYRRLAFTRYGQQVLTQLVYTIWFNERPMQDGSDMNGGRLDGLTWRVTLGPDGQPLIFDSIHPCGCIHQFFPTSQLRARPRPDNDPLIDWAFSPIPVPIDEWLKGPVSALRLRITTREHQLVALSRASDTSAGGTRARSGSPNIGENAPYRSMDADALRSLPLPGGGHRSAFDPRGIIPGTERYQRLLYWVTGVKSAGSMRQWGRQPTAFVGRRHFDDADLIERRYQWIGAEQADRR